MKNLTKSLLSALLIAGTGQLDAACCTTGGSTVTNTTGCCSTNCSTDCSNDCSNGCGNCVTTYIPRSVGDNTAREMQEHYTHKYDQDCFNGGVSVVFEYQRSFRGERLARCLFGDCNLSFVGSDAVPTGSRAPRDILADNFGMSPAANTTISFNPRIENFIVDFQGYFGFDEWWCGSYLRVHMPVAHTRWDLRAECGARNCCDTGCSTSCNDCSFGCSTGCSTNCSTGCSNTCDSLATCSLNTTPFNAGCVGLISQGPITPAANVQEALSGDFLFGAMQTPWKFGRFKFCRQTDTKLADLDLNFGWNFWNCEDYHLGVYLKYVAPTGTRIDACHARNVFTPVVGNGRFNELGAGLTAHAELWNCDDDQSICMYIEGYAVHKFKKCQVRTFDLNNGCLSRYLLLKEFTQDGDTGEFVANGNLISAVDWATRFADVSVDVLGDASIKFVYRNCGWALGIGYNIYGTTKENVCIKSTFADSSLNGRFFGIKGCAPVQAEGFQTELVPPTTGVETISTPEISALRTLSSTQSNATIFGCGTTDNAVDLRVAAVGIGSGFFYVDTCADNVDTIVPGTTLTGDLTVAEESATGTLAIDTATGAITGLTLAPAILSDANLNNQSAANPRQISHKIFGTIDYAWLDCDWSPFVGILAEGEFASRENCCTLNQWGVGVRGGVSF